MKKALISLVAGLVLMTAGCAIMAGAVRLIAATALPRARVAVQSPAD